MSNNSIIPVTKPYLPSRERLNKYLDGIYDRQWLTNNGQLVKELTVRLEEYLGVENLLLVSNGTLALQIAYRVLGISDAKRSEQVPEAITTPFTFIATASSLKWEGVEPIFADINPFTWCLEPKNIEAKVTENTRAILPVHVFGNACDVESIEKIAKKHNLKVVYDACHAFGVKYKGESLLKWGDAATLSFHATKLFHTAEGGAIVFKRKEDLELAKKLINFGITGLESIEVLGINAKMNEIQAAMGLSILDEIENNLATRERVWMGYIGGLPKELTLQKISENTTYNFAYFPILLKSEAQVKNLASKLKDKGVLVRRYFYPSLDTLDINFLSNSCAISRDIASRIVCLPLYSELNQGGIDKILETVKEVV